ncbi:UDP-glucose 4-epimerase [subsurface metagenome]
MTQALVTGVAGFIGFHTAQRLLNESFTVIGIDNLNNYYAVKLKKTRLEQLQMRNRFSFIKGDLENRKVIEGVFNDYEFDFIIHCQKEATSFGGGI